MSDRRISTTRPAWGLALLVVLGACAIPATAAPPPLAAAPPADGAAPTSLALRFTAGRDLRLPAEAQASVEQQLRKQVAEVFASRPVTLVGPASPVLVGWAPFATTPCDTADCLADLGARLPVRWVVDALLVGQNFRDTLILTLVDVEGRRQRSSLIVPGAAAADFSRTLSSWLPEFLAPVAARSPRLPEAVPPGMVYVPRGLFGMGSWARASESPPHSVLVSAFFLDRTEVTVAAWAACVAERSCAPGPATGAAERDRPIDRIDWASADAFCRARGKRLPTEAEWEYAASGTDRRRFPWGDGAPSGPVCWSGPASQRGTPALADRCAAGSSTGDVGPFGARDLAGNVEEWVADFYAESYEADPLRDPKGPATGEYHVIRGGDWEAVSNSVLTNTRRSFSAGTDRLRGLGFRCARDAEPR